MVVAMRSPAPVAPSIEVLTAVETFIGGVHQGHSFDMWSLPTILVAMSIF
jgi:hypothetical protein